MIENSDLERGIRFETYAISRIKGGIIDELRAIDWIPRSVRFKAREVEKALRGPGEPPASQSHRRRGRQQLGITTDELHQIFSQISFVSWSPSTSLSRSAPSAGTGSACQHPGGQGCEDPVAVFESQEMKGIMDGAINRLGERRRS